MSSSLIYRVVIAVTLVVLLIEIPLINAYRLSAGPFLTHRLFNHGEGKTGVLSSSILIAHRHNVASIELYMSSSSSESGDSSSNSRHFDYLVIGGGI
jgi:hypothetical protein